MDVTSLLEPRSDENVSGENLEYDPLFTDLELVAQPGEERQEGDTILPAEDPEWPEVIRKASDVLAVSHDLRAAVYYAQAVLVTEGLGGFAKVVEYIQGCLDQHWDTCHPQLDEDDGDPTMRINAVQGLAGADQVVRSLRRAGLTNSRMFGKMSLRDMEIAEGVIPVPEGMEEVPDTAAISAALQDSDQEELSQILAAAINARDGVKAIDDLFGEKTPGQGPTFDNLTQTLNGIIKRLSEAVGGGEVVAEEGAEDGAAPQSGGSAPISGAVNTQADVLAAIDKIIGYYARTEPSSPVPILLERAKKLVGADFMAIMENMAPDGVANVKLIGGTENDW